MMWSRTSTAYMRCPFSPRLQDRIADEGAQRTRLSKKGLPENGPTKNVRQPLGQRRECDLVCNQHRELVVRREREGKRQTTSVIPPRPPFRRNLADLRGA